MMADSVGNRVFVFGTSVLFFVMQVMFILISFKGEKVRGKNVLSNLRMDMIV